MQRIAVIGAGAAGLCAARHLSCLKNYEPVVFESTNQVGGTWVYTDLIDRDENGKKVHSSMYKNLRTNLPKEVMLFPGFPFESSLPSFLTHADVKEYLNSYCDHYNLRKHIKFQTSVEEVVLVDNNSLEKSPKWKVTSFNFETKVEDVDIYDGVFVCNGHYSDPYIPSISGMENYKGKIIHSHQYRSPEPYKDRTVVLLGSKASGSDISIDVAKVAKKVIISHCRAPLVSKLPDNVTQGVGVVSFTEKGVILEDGSTVECDDFIFCTGYLYTFPFFKKEKYVEINEQRITPLHKHLVNIKYHNLFFIGLCLQICPFPQFDCQVMYSLSVLNRTLKLPSDAEMLRIEEEEFQDRLAMGFKKKHAHMMGPMQWAYNDYLASTSLNPCVPNQVRLLYDLTTMRRNANLVCYKKDKIGKGANGNYYIIS